MSLGISRIVALTPLAIAVVDGRSTAWNASLSMWVTRRHAGIGSEGSGISGGTPHHRRGHMDRGA
jgi:hypothetical protein